MNKSALALQCGCLLGTVVLPTVASAQDQQPCFPKNPTAGCYVLATQKFSSHLVSAFTTARKQQGELKLLRLTNKVHDLMQITKLYTVFDIRDDETVKSFDLPVSVSA